MRTLQGPVLTVQVFTWNTTLVVFVAGATETAKTLENRFQSETS